jgi:hypothetical protein
VSNAPPNQQVETTQLPDDFVTMNLCGGVSMSEALFSAASDAQVIACPRCGTGWSFARSYPSRIDSCGFENYSLNCPKCYARFEGFIDPTDEALLLSQTAP